MGRKKTTGLFKKQGIWQIDKQIFGRRIRVTTGITSLAEAEIILARHVEALRQVVLFGAREHHTFEEAVTRYLEEKQYKASIHHDRRELLRLMPYFSGKSLELIHMGTLKPFIEKRKQEGVKHRTINMALQAVRHLLNLAASEWLNEDGTPWLNQLRKIRLLKEIDKRPPYPLSWDEQERFFNLLPAYLKQMALFKVNTGCRDQEVCDLQWSWEHFIPELETSVFIIPDVFVKNRQARLVILNTTAKQVVERRRGEHPDYVFTHKGRRLYQMNNTAWQTARERFGIPVRVHDLKHTFGRRLRAAGVCFEDRQDLLGHKSSRITTHYSAAEISQLIEASNKVCDRQIGGPTLTLLRQSTKTPTISPRSKKVRLSIVG